MRVPSHAAVGTSVELVRESVGERPVRLVNAVLRKVGSADLDGWLGEVAPALADDPIAAAGRHDVASTVGRRRFSRRPADRRAASGRQRRRDRAAEGGARRRQRRSAGVARGPAGPVRLSTSCWPPAAAPGRWSPYAATLPAGDPGALDAVRSGRAGVQDEGSQLAALAVSRASVDGTDTRWLDLCAGPGGKSALLAGIGVERGAALLAAERQPHRARLVASALRALRAAERRSSPPTAPARRGAPARSTASSPTFPARVSARCAVARRHGGAAARPTSRGSRRCSGRCSTAPSTAPGPAAWSRTSPAHHTSPRHETSSTRLRALGATSSRSTRATLLPEVTDLGPGPHVQLWPHRARHGRVVRLRPASTIVVPALDSSTDGHPDCAEHPVGRLRQPPAGCGLGAVRPTGCTSTSWTTTSSPTSPSAPRSSSASAGGRAAARLPPDDRRPGPLGARVRRGRARRASRFTSRRLPRPCGWRASCVRWAPEREWR